MKLADYLNERPQYCGPGEYDCVIKKARHFSYKTGTRGVEFELETSNGQITKAAFALTEKAYNRLAWFAQTCGLSDAEMRRYDPTDQLAHNVLVGRKVRVLVGRKDDEKYDTVQSWKPAGVVLLPAPVVSESTRVPTGDEIPF